MTGDPVFMDEALSPSVHDDADLLQFLEGLDDKFASPGASEEAFFPEVLKDTGSRARMCASRSLPDLPMAGSKAYDVPTERRTIRTVSADYSAASFFKPDAPISRVGSGHSTHLHTHLAPGSEISSSVIMERWQAAEFEPPIEPYVQNWGAAWGHCSANAPGAEYPPQECSPPPELHDRVVPNVLASYGPIFTATTFNQGTLEASAVLVRASMAKTCTMICRSMGPLNLHGNFHGTFRVSPASPVHLPAITAALQTYADVVSCAHWCRTELAWQRSGSV